MPTVSKTLPKPAAWVTCATGPQNVTFNSQGQTGMYRITVSGQPTPAVFGHPVPGARAESLALDTGEILQFYGLGVINATATTFDAAFDALTDVTG